MEKYLPILTGLLLSEVLYLTHPKRAWSACQVTPPDWWRAFIQDSGMLWKWRIQIRG